MSALVCALSGEVPAEPVVSTKSGHIFEKKLIIKYIEVGLPPVPPRGAALRRPTAPAPYTSPTYMQYLHCPCRCFGPQHSTDLLLPVLWCNVSLGSGISGIIIACSMHYEAFRG